jgi:hypothetical protein
MTAELFIKLSSKMYADRKRHDDFDVVPDISLPYYLDKEHSSPQTSNEDGFIGGPKLSSKSSKGDLLDLSVQTSVGTRSMAMNQNFPSTWHAKQRQKLNVNNYNPYSVLENAGESVGNSASDSGMEEDVKPDQWIPKMESSFWNLYANKLRVNASEDGVCDLNDQNT